MAEDLSEYLGERGIKVMYIHYMIDTLERVEILRDLRKGKYDVLVGINLLREGLDLPEVSLVTILDADKEGFLRSKTSLIQTTGRAARHVEGKVIMYADKVTGSMKEAIVETDRRRQIQRSYNKKHNEANGENNRDGLDHNESWNCGVEGPSDDPTVLSLRARQKRNFFLALLLAQGIPMIQMGDEVGHTKGGNNNTW